MEDLNPMEYTLDSSRNAAVSGSPGAAGAPLNAGGPVETSDEAVHVQQSQAVCEVTIESRPEVERTEGDLSGETRGVSKESSNQDSNRNASDGRNDKGDDDMEIVALDGSDEHGTGVVTVEPQRVNGGLCVEPSVEGAMATSEASQATEHGDDRCTRVYDLFAVTVGYFYVSMY